LKKLRKFETPGQAEASSAEEQLARDSPVKESKTGNASQAGLLDLAVPRKNLKKQLFYKTQILTVVQFIGGRDRIEDKCLQNFLNEFCYKYNRRYFEEQVFHRLSICAVLPVWY
jgi:hypothetical protein